MPARRPAAIAVAAGLMAVAAGTAGLLTRHPVPALRPPPRGVATVAAPTRPAASPPGLAAFPPVLSASPAGPSAAAPVPSASPTGAPSGSRPDRQAQVARPVSLTIPLIGVKTPLVTLGVTADGALQVPSSAAVAGWYTGSPRPGSVGPAVIAGHVDSLTGPGVFFRLSELRRGDMVYVKRADGTIVDFRVTSVQIWKKDAFPAESVYGATPDAELRLITCGGTFDYATGHYLSNTIVYAVQAG